MEILSEAGDRSLNPDRQMPRWAAFSQWVLVLSIFLSLEIEGLCLLFVCARLLLRKKVYISPRILLGFLAIVPISVITILYQEYPFGKFLQQSVLLLGFTLLEADFFHFNLDWLDSLFRKYLYVSLAVACSGLIQQLLWTTSGINIFTFFFRDTGRLTGFAMMEPGRLAGVLLPAFVYYLFSTRLHKALVQKTILLFAIFLTDGAAAIALVPVVAAARLCYVYGKGFVRKRLFFAACVIAIFMSAISAFLMKNDWDVSEHRTLYMIKSVGELFDDQSLDSIERQNLSTYAFAKNLWVALHSPSRIIGTGLGTHEFNHDSVYSVIANNEFYFLNREDGYSLLIRIFSEFGIVGLIVVLFCFVRWYNPKNLINFSVSFVLMAFFLRGGHYVLNGTIFFVMLYYFTARRGGKKPSERNLRKN